MMAAAHHEPQGLEKWFPAWRWLRGYALRSMRADAIAGLTLAAYLIPTGIGAASVAHLPPVAGLYACMFSGLVFWIYCSARRTVVTVTTSISLLVGVSLAPIAMGDPLRYATLAAATSLLVAGIAFVAWMVRAGGVVNFISESVLVGFKTGIALVLISTQLPKLFGLESLPEGYFFERLWDFITRINYTHLSTLIMGTIALLVLLLGQRALPRVPAALLVVTVGVAVTFAFHLDHMGVAVLGSVPEGLPKLALPKLSVADWNTLLPLATACLMLGAVETAAIGRTNAAKYGEHFNANQEFLALAAANAAAGLGQGFPVSGGISQSMVNENAGSVTPLSGFMAAIVLLCVVLFLAPAFQFLPETVVAALVLVAVLPLFRIREFIHLFRTAREEFLVATAALVGVLFSGLLHGVLIGALLSLFMLTRKVAMPHVAILGRIPSSQRFSDRARHKDNEPIPGVLICRPEAALLYFNVDGICDRILRNVRLELVRPKLVILDLSASPYVDVQSAQTLGELHGELAELGIRLQIVEAIASVRDTLRSQGLEQIFGRIDRFTTIADAVDDFQRGARPPMFDDVG
jgi:SulP family sulfate permease